jgi:hypothetical protein
MILPHRALQYVEGIVNRTPRAFLGGELYTANLDVVRTWKVQLISARRLASYLTAAGRASALTIFTGVRNESMRPSRTLQASFVRLFPCVQV